MKWFSLLASIVIAVLPAGCGDAPGIEPPQVRYGVDACDQCLMIISDDRYAAGAVVETDGRLEPRRFDDVGCLLEIEKAEADSIRARYVRAYDGDRWLELDAAAFLHSNDLHSPMAFGVAAFATVEAADAKRGEFPGDVLDVAALRERFARGRLSITPTAGGSE